MRLVLVLVLVLVLAPFARADEAQDALALARSVVERHRSDEHRRRFDVVFAEPAAVASTGAARLEARSGRYAVEQRGYDFTVAPEGARLTVVARTHIPVFAARAARRRDSAQLLEARVPLARARVALLALELVASAREKPKDATTLDPLDPRLDAPEESADDEWPRLSVAGGGWRSTRRGAFAELGRRLLDELGAECGLGAPLDRATALRRLVPALAGTSDEAARAAFILGDAAFVEAWPRLEKLDFEEARDAREKIAAAAAKDARARLVALATSAGSWDVRRWARERLDVAEWVLPLLAKKVAPEDALVEALGELDSKLDPSGEKVAPLLDDARPLVRVEAAAALLRITGSPRARQVLAAVAADSKAGDEGRETAIARLAAALPGTELGPLLAPIVADRDAAPSVRAQAARCIDQAEAVSEKPALIDALDAELAKPSPDEPRRDLRLALVGALATCATKDALAGTKDEDALRALGRAAAAETEDDVRALAIHALGAVPSDAAAALLKTVATAEAKRELPDRLALHAADMELAARGQDASAKLVAIADAACEAPLRSTLERLARAARDPAAREALVERLKARGPEGEAGLQVLERR